MRKIKLLFLVILPLIWFGFMYNVSAYNYNGYAIASKTDFYAYYNDNQVFHILCENGASCNYSSADMSVQGLTNVPFNQLRWLTRDVLNTNFVVGGTYKAVLFYEENYLTSSGPQVLKHWTNNYTATAVCRSYNNTTSWTASVLDDCLLQFNKVESTTSGNYTTDVWSIVATFKPTTTDIGVLSFRFNFNEVYALNTPAGYFSFTMERYSSINATALPDGSVIDYSDNFNDVINNQNQNTQDIINNQNQNTQAIIDSNKSCTSYDKTAIVSDNYRLQNDGSLISGNNFGTSDYIPINSDSTFSVINNVSVSANYTRYCFYTSTKTYISCNTVDNVTINTNLTIPQNASYIRFAINKNENRPIYKICKNGSQAVADAITDTTPPDTSEFSDMAGWLPPGPVDSILTLPISLLNNLTSSLSGTCQAVDLPLPFVNTTISLPCINTIYEEIGIQTFLNWIGGIASAFILFRYLMKLYKWVDDTLTLRENTQADWGGD